MPLITIDTFKAIWLKTIVGKPIADRSNDLHSFLYDSYISRNDELIKLLNLTIPTSTQVKFLQELVICFSTINTSALGFFPVCIINSKGLTCAGNTLLTSTLLKNMGYDVLYARPVGHSLSLVRYENQYYWVDTTNNILEIVDIEIEERKTFSIATLKSTSDKIIYKTVPIFEHRAIIVNVFGNIETLKNQTQYDVTVKEYLRENTDIYKLDFHSLTELLFKEYFDYVRYDKEFQKEQKRVGQLLHN
ncbi:MAG: hypothetical protein RLY61_289 [Candidatus Parcubacteria bacterium]|jgi:hypothetical protein